MSHDLSGVEVPRLVKKPGDYKRVETLDDLRAALEDGWVLRLEPPAPEVDFASVLTADLERQAVERATAQADATIEDELVEEPDAESKPRKPGRPRRS